MRCRVSRCTGEAVPGTCGLCEAHSTCPECGQDVRDGHLRGCMQVEKPRAA